MVKESLYSRKVGLCPELCFVCNTSAHGLFIYILGYTSLANVKESAFAVGIIGHNSISPNEKVMKIWSNR
jgi:hypothetical protein